MWGSNSAPQDQELNALLSQPSCTLKIRNKKALIWAPGWLSGLSIWLLILAHVMIPQFVSLRPTSGSMLITWSLLRILSPSLYLSPTQADALFQNKNKLKKKKKQRLDKTTKI